ncbi:MAG: hypothetical protein A4E49_01936 [Methanosaeta sp. PtaU1.Bin112]|nr:MAG: hypothetical protein A4E49_01936 [Methanosaeta sp. PtaU1.Bin112]
MSTVRPSRTLCLPKLLTTARAEIAGWILFNFLHLPIILPFRLFPAQFQILPFFFATTSSAPASAMMIIKRAAQDRPALTGSTIM